MSICGNPTLRVHGKQTDFYEGPREFRVMSNVETSKCRYVEIRRYEYTGNRQTFRTGPGSSGLCQMSKRRDVDVWTCDAAITRETDRLYDGPRQFWGESTSDFYASKTVCPRCRIFQLGCVGCKFFTQDSNELATHSFRYLVPTMVVTVGISNGY
jgi:hypothetical protein